MHVYAPCIDTYIRIHVRIIKKEKDFRVGRNGRRQKEDTREGLEGGKEREVI